VRKHRHGRKHHRGEKRHAQDESNVSISN
jgi:hypothetical protein